MWVVWFWILCFWHFVAYFNERLMSWSDQMLFKLLNHGRVWHYQLIKDIKSWWASSTLNDDLDQHFFMLIKRDCLCCRQSPLSWVEMYLCRQSQGRVDRLQNFLTLNLASLVFLHCTLAQMMVCSSGEGAYCPLFLLAVNVHHHQLTCRPSWENWPQWNRATEQQKGWVNDRGSYIWAWRKNQKLSQH